jgi:hypothetical protein
VLIGYFSHAPNGFLTGAYAAAITRRLQFLLAHRPGFVAPTVAARKLATLDHLRGGTHRRPPDHGGQRRGAGARRGLHRPRCALSPHPGLCSLRREVATG